jgi:hypothetical protein
MIPDSSTLNSERFSQTVSDELAALAPTIKQQRPKSLPLDYSYASLDRVEDFYQSRLDADGSSDTLDSQLAYYVGATLADSTGGRWEPARTKSDLGRASIVGLPSLGKLKFYPLDVVLNFKRTRSSGYLRDATEPYDLPLRREALEQLVSNADERIDDLRSDLRDLIGRDTGAPDGSPESLSVIEEGLKKALATNASRELLRRLENGATLYLGKLLQQAVGGQWRVNEDPQDANLGQFEVNGWAPIAIIRNVGPQSRSNIIQTALQLAIKGRSKR